MEMNRLLIDFVKSIRARQTSSPRPHQIGEAGGAAGGTGEGEAARAVGAVKEIVIDVSENGFPKLPLRVTEDLSKKEWEILL